MTAPHMTLDGFHPEFADFAQAMAADRLRTYPAKVAAGDFSQAEADHRIFVMSAIAEIWRCATDNLMPQQRYYPLTKAEAVDTLNAAIDLAERRLRRQPGHAGHQRHLDQLKAMYWWHNHYGAKAYVLNMALNLRYEGRMRAEQAAAEQVAA